MAEKKWPSQNEFQNMTMKEFAEWELHQLCIEHDRIFMEAVLVFKTELLGDSKFQGLVKDTQELDNLVPLILNLSNLSFMDRAVAENDFSHKQLIPYCMIESVIDNQRKILVYERSKKGGESRLHNLYSLGIGGHINPCDETINLKDTYIMGLMRELKEEVSIKGGYFNRIVGLLNDDSNNVGKVHFGVVHQILLNKETTLEFKDDALLNPQFQDVYWIQQNVDKFENWSKLVIEGLL